MVLVLFAAPGADDHLRLLRSDGEPWPPMRSASIRNVAENTGQSGGGSRSRRSPHMEPRRLRRSSRRGEAASRGRGSLRGRGLLTSNADVGAVAGALVDQPEATSGQLHARVAPGHVDVRGKLRSQSSRPMCAASVGEQKTMPSTPPARTCVTRKALGLFGEGVEVRLVRVGPESSGGLSRRGRLRRRRGTGLRPPGRPPPRCAGRRRSGCLRRGRRACRLGRRSSHGAGSASRRPGRGSARPAVPRGARPLEQVAQPFDSLIASDEHEARLAGRLHLAEVLGSGYSTA